MRRAAIKLACAGVFDDAAKVHNGNPVAHKFHHAQIMRNKHICQVLFLLQIFHQVQDLSLNRNIQRGNRFVAYKRFRIHAHGTRNADSLALAAGEFVGEAVHIVCRELNRLQQLSDPLDPLGPRFSDSMDLHGLVKCLQNRLRRIQ